MVTHPNASRDRARLADVRLGTTIGLAGVALIAAAGLVVVTLSSTSGAPAGAGSSRADRPSVVPAPLELDVLGGAPFTLSGGTPVLAEDPVLADVAAAYAEAVRERTGLALPADDGHARIRFALDAALAPEEYRIEVRPTGIRVDAGDAAGAFWAVQTLLQLPAPGDDENVPAVTVHDAPRFAYRAAMLDVARHFFTVEDVERYLDRVASLKLNVLHLHLTDDQGWRIAISAHPQLAEIGGRYAVDSDPGGFYTQDDYRRIVAYAAERFITIVPEVDMPGHTNAALASLPQLNPGGKVAKPYTGIEVGFSTLDTASETTYAVIGDVLTELAALTPGPYLHIGGDESHATDPADYRAFVERTARIAADTGKTVIGWHQLGQSDALPPGTVGQYWGYVQPEPADAEEARSILAQGGRLIMSPADVAYLDMKYDFLTPRGLTWANGYTSIEDAYSWDPAAVVSGVAEDAILGVEAPIWTETLRTMDEVEEMAMPRLATMAEVAWTPQAERDYAGFVPRLVRLAARWDAEGVRHLRPAGIPWA
ncbi:MAG: beta-N-acetylhexosaminidase [Micrococcales bacterium]|nr:beta-N-acetylhexosaminidase [Micrococcales bacterium]